MANPTGAEPVPTPHDRVRVVLVEPAGPLNVGSIARAMKNFGLRHLAIVNPQCDPCGREARQMAVHAGDILAGAVVVDTLPAALAGCRAVAATVGRDVAARDTPIAPPAVAMPWLWAGAAAGQSVAIVFGREDRGLLNPELDLAQQLIRIPTVAAYESMNLAQAATVCFYELGRGADRGETPPAVDRAGDGPTIAIAAADAPTFEQTEGFYGDLERLLVSIGYLHPHTAASRMKTFRRLLHRAAPSAREVAMLRGILRQVRWAIAQPPDNPSP